jgi:hypothetical protein
VTEQSRENHEEPDPEDFDFLFASRDLRKEILEIFAADERPALTSQHIAKTVRENSDPIDAKHVEIVTKVENKLRRMRMNDLVEGISKSGIQMWRATAAPDLTPLPPDEVAEQDREVTHQEVLKGFDTTSSPVLTTGEVALKLSISEEKANSILAEMKEEGLIGGEFIRPEQIWWPRVAPALSDEAQRRADAADPDDAVSLAELEAEFAGEA